MIISNYIDVLKKYTVFEGRVGRPEFWYFQLVHMAISAVLAILFWTVSDMVRIIQVIYGLGVLLPDIAVSARRLHDTGRSGWWQLLFFIPVIGWIVLIVMWTQKGDPDENKYGAPPA